MRLHHRGRRRHPYAIRRSRASRARGHRSAAGRTRRAERTISRRCRSLEWRSTRGVNYPEATRETSSYAPMHRRSRPAGAASDAVSRSPQSGSAPARRAKFSEKSGLRDSRPDGHRAKLIEAMDAMSHDICVARRRGLPATLLNGDRSDAGTGRSARKRIGKYLDLSSSKGRRRRPRASRPLSRTTAEIATAMRLARRIFNRPRSRGRGGASTHYAPLSQ